MVGAIGGAFFSLHGIARKMHAHQPAVWEETQDDAEWSAVEFQQIWLLGTAAASGLLLLLNLARRSRNGALHRRAIEVERATAAAAQARFEDAIESLSEGFSVYDAEDRLVLCNEAQRAAHPRAPNAFRPGRKYADIMRDITERGLLVSDPLEAERVLQKLIDLHRSSDGTVERQAVDGSWIRLSKRRTREGGVVTIRADISELKAQQQELAEKTAMLETILDNIGSGFTAFDQDFQLIAWNKLYMKMNDVPSGFLKVGLPLEDLIRHSISVGVLGPGDPEVQLADRLAVLRVPTPRSEIQERADGRIVQIIAQPLPTGGFLALLTDITESRQAENERRRFEDHLQHSQKLEALGTLAGGVAHDLNNSLVPVVSLTKLLMNKQAEESPERRRLELIYQAGLRARDLVKQILAFSRKDAPQHALVDLAPVMDEAINMLRATIPATIRLDCRVAVVPALMADPGQLIQVIVNLVTNAAQAIGDQAGVIHIGLAEDSGDKLPDAPYLRLSVRDTGCGIPESVRARIFDPFFTTKDVGKGTGLGLSVVHGIVTAHGGKIEVTSNPGEGTEFSLYLPIAPPVLRAADPSASAA